MNVYIFNAVESNLAKLTTKSSWYFRSVVSAWYCRLSALGHFTSVFQGGGPLNGLVVGLMGIEQFPAQFLVYS